MSLADYYFARGKQLVLISRDTKAFKGIAHSPALGAFPLHQDSPTFALCGRRFYMALTRNDATQLQLSDCAKCLQSETETIDIIPAVP